MESDHAWLLTPPEPGAIAVIRLQGPNAARLMAAHFSKPLRLDHCVHGEFRNEAGDIVDDPIVVQIDAGTVDINVHGGGAIVRAVLALAKRAGFHLAAPESTRTDLSDDVQQEVDAALPLAKTRLALSTLLAQPQAWRNAEWTPQQIGQVLADRSLYWLLHPPTVAIIGLPNAGKSTLANQLFGRDRSIVYDRPGTTRDWVKDDADAEGLPVWLVDTPGIRQTSDAIEKSAIENSLAHIEVADLVLFVLDLTQPRLRQDELLLRFPAALRVIGKADLPATWTVDPPADYRVVALTGDGVSAIRSAIRRHFLGDNLSADRPRVWTERQRAYLHALRAVTA